MLRNAEYIYNNIIIEDNINTTKKHCKKAQVGVDCTLAGVFRISEAGAIYRDKSKVSKYEKIDKMSLKGDESVIGWFLPKGTYMIMLNEGCQFGPNDTGYLVQRSSLNRSGCTVISSVWDPGYTSRDGDVVNQMGLRLNVDTDRGIFIEENARIAQLLVVSSEDTTSYNGQFQGGSLTSRLDELQYNDSVCCEKSSDLAARLQAKLEAIRGDL